MKVTDFAKQITQQEGLKKGVDIAQISEVLKVANSLLDGQLYSLIKKQPEFEILNPKKLADGRALINKGNATKTAKKMVAKKNISKKKS